MTIFRIDTKALQKHVEIARLARELEENLKRMDQQLANANLIVKGVTMCGAQLYRQADDKLKDKSLAADDRKTLIELRKAAYDLNLRVKGLAEALGLR